MNNIISILQKRSQNQHTQQDSLELNEFISSCFKKECIRHDQSLVQFLSSELVIECLPQNGVFQIRDEDDFLILLEGEIMGISRQIRFNPGSIFGGAGDNKMIVFEKLFKCITDCVFGRVDLQKLHDFYREQQVNATQKVTELLTQCRYFSLWNSNQIEKIISHSTRVNFKKNQWAFCEGQLATSVYVILSGQFSIYKRIFTTNQSNAELPQNQSAKQQIIPSKKFIDLNVGDVIGEEDDINDERFYGLRCRSDSGQLLRLPINKFVGISRLSEKTYQQILERKRNVRQKLQKFDESYKYQSIEMSTIDSNNTQTTIIQSRSGQASHDSSPLNSSETLTILNSSTKQNIYRPVIQMMQSKNTSANISLIKESKQTSEHDLSLNNAQESKVASHNSSLNYINDIHSRQTSSEAHSPQKRLYKSSSQASISSNELKFIPISFRMEYLKSKRKLEMGLDKIRRHSKMPSPQESIQMIKSNLRAETRDSSSEKFSEDAYKNISKEIKSTHTAKFWHQMQAHCLKLATYSKKFINEQQNQYIKQDPNDEARPLVRNIQKKIQQMNNQKNESQSNENSMHYRRFASTQDLSYSPKKVNTSHSQAQLFLQNESQKSFQKIPNEVTSFTEAVEKTMSQNYIQTQEQQQQQEQLQQQQSQQDETLSPIRIPSAKKLTLQSSRQSLTDLFPIPVRKEKSLYLKQYISQHDSHINKSRGYSAERRTQSLLRVNKIQSCANSQSQLEISTSKANLEENKVMIIQSNDNHNKQQTQSVQITPSFYYNRQKRQLVQKSIQQEQSQSSINKSNNNLISLMTQSQHQQKQQRDFNESPVRSTIQSIYSPAKRQSKVGLSVPMQDYSQISRKYQLEKEENSKQQLLNRFLNSHSQTSSKLKSLNTIIRKKEM